MFTAKKAIALLFFFAFVASMASFKSLERRSIGTPQYGICNLATIPLRADHSHKSEAVTHMIFGEAYMITHESADGEWLQVRMSDDHYQGWIPNSQFKQISKDYFRKYKATNHPVLTAPISQLLSDVHGQIIVSIGSILPFYKNGEINIDGETFRLQDPQAVADPALISSAPTSIATRYMHAPYLWGGKSIFGIDCSGFVQQVYKTAQGVYLPRDAYQQATVGEEIPWHESRPGDLAFFKNASGRIVHVGIIMPNHQIIHASGKVRIDKFTPEGIFVEDKGQHSHHLAFVRRI